MKIFGFLRLPLTAGYLILCSSVGVFAEKHTVLVALTHGDDLVPVAPLVARTSAEGNAVYFAMFTGLQDPSGEEGSKARQDVNCAAGAVGVKETFVMRGPAGESLGTIKAVADRLIEIIDQTKPDVIITWGPDGMNGHPRHIMVGDVVTRVFQRQANLQHKPRKLYYIAYPESRFPETRLPLGQIGDLDGPFGTVSDSFITTRVDGRRYVKQTREAIRCFALPHDEGSLKKSTDMITTTLGNSVFLRLVMPAALRRETSIFAGL